MKNKIPSIWLYGEIGIDFNGSDIANQIKLYETLGYEKLDVRICSAGGTVDDGMAIYNAILNSNMEITTYNDFWAFSSAGWIFLAGDKRKCATNSEWMCHNPEGKQNTKFMQKVKNQLEITLSERTGIERTLINEMMNSTTFLDADQMLKGGLCDEIYSNKRTAELTNLFSIVNKAELKNTENINTICNKITSKFKMINNLKNVLNIEDEEMNESGIISKITEITNSNNELKNSLTEKEAKITELTNSFTEKEALLTEMKTKVEELNIQIEKLETEKSDAEITNFLDSSIRDGKVTAEEKTEYFNLAKKDFTTVKNLISKRPVNKVSVQIPTTVTNNVKGVDAERANWTIRDWEQKDSKGLGEMLQNTPELYNELFNKFYK